MQVLSYLVRRGEASRKKIADDLSVTSATLTNVSSELIQKGIIYEKGVLDTGSVGRKEIAIDIAPNYCYALGLDVANRYLRVTLLNVKMELVAMREWRYTVLTLEILNEAFIYLKKLVTEYGKEKILGLGLLGQGYVYQQQFLSLPINDIYQRVKAELDIDIYCTNNIRGIAITQSFLREGEDNFLMLHYGPGICTIMVADGAVIGGFHNKAGEIGHTLLDPSSTEVCSVCGKAGCLESILGFESVAKKADPSYHAIYTDFENLEKACRNDGGAALDEALAQLAKIVTLLLSFYDPQEFLLCGEIFTVPKYYSRFMKLLFGPDKSSMPANVSLVENYSEKRWKSAGIVVMNEYFGRHAQKTIL